MRTAIGTLVVCGVGFAASGQVYTIDFEDQALGTQIVGTQTYNGNASFSAQSWYDGTPHYQTVVAAGLSGGLSGHAVRGELSGDRGMYGVTFTGGSGPLFPEYYVGGFSIGSTLSEPLEIQVIRFGQAGSVLSRENFVVPAGEQGLPGVLDVDLSSYSATTGVSIVNINDVRDIGAFSYFDSFVYSPDPVPAPASAAVLGVGGLVLSRRRRDRA